MCVLLMLSVRTSYRCYLLLLVDSQFRAQILADIFTIFIVAHHIVRILSRRTNSTTLPRNCSAPGQAAEEPRSSPNLEAQSWLDGIPDEILLGFQCIHQQIRIFGWLVEIVVLSEIEMVQVWQRHCWAALILASTNLSAVDSFSRWEVSQR